MAEKSFGIKQINMIGVGTPAIESSDDLIINTNGSERIRILGGGDVGIGTTNPGNKLEVNGTVKIGSNTLVSPNGNADNFIIDTGDVDSGLSILSATTGRIYFGDAADNDVGSIRYVHTDNSMRFETAGTERLRIYSTGYAEFYSGAVTRVLLSDDVSTTSGTSITFPSSGSIPSWATKITLLFDRVSTTGGSEFLVQLGTSGGAITSGYDSSSSNSSGSTLETSTAGFVLYVNAGSSELTGKMEIQRAGTSKGWISAHTMKNDGNTRDGAGVLTTHSGTVDKVILTTEGGSNTFDGGAVTVYYEA